MVGFADDGSAESPWRARDGAGAGGPDVEEGRAAPDAVAAVAAVSSAVTPAEPDGGEPPVEGAGVRRTVRYRTNRPAGGEVAKPHSFRIEDSVWERARRRALRNNHTMNYVVRALVSAYARGRLRVGEAVPAVDVVRPRGPYGRHGD